MSGKFQESGLAHSYLDGLKGVEIGGSAHNAFGLDTINVDYTGDMDTKFKQAEREICGEAMKVDLVASGDALPLEDNSFDFVISSHVVEHFFDPIRALKEWARVAKSYIFTIVPHPERTFDKGREITPLQELIDRHSGKLTIDDYQQGPDYGTRAEGHWTVWTAESFKEMCEYLGFNVTQIQDPDDKVGNGFTVVIKL